MIFQNLIFCKIIIARVPKFLLMNNPNIRYRQKEGANHSKGNAVNFLCEEIATRLSGSLFLKWYHFKNPYPLTLRDAFLNGTPYSFYYLRQKSVFTFKIRKFQQTVGLPVF